MGRSSWFLMHYRPSNVSPKSRWLVKLAIRVRKTPILQIIGPSIASFPRQVRCHLPEVHSSAKLGGTLDD